MRKSDTVAANKSPYQALSDTLEVLGFGTLLFRLLLLIDCIIRPWDLSGIGLYANSLREFISLCACLLAIAFFQGSKTLAFLVDIGLASRKALIDMLIGFLAGTVLISTMLGAMYLVGGFTVDSWRWPVDLMPAMLLFFIVAFTEELIFRGYIFKRLETGYGTIAAVILSSLLFGFAHYSNPVDNVTLNDKLYFCSVLSLEAGLPLAGAYLLTRRLWLPIGLHWAWDFMEGTIYGFNVSGTDIGPSVMNPVLSSNLFSSGGPFGPEASMPAFIIGSLAGAIFLYMSYKQAHIRPWRVKD